ncbi:MAG: SGNH/GDSL hydrolase family protein [Planctomycetes bacterium]|nr:SGNH/GDSL hydrolase family protein [Planctomycetota bacterium]
MKRIVLIVLTAAGGLLAGVVLAEIALRFVRLDSTAPVVRYTIQRNSPLFSPALDATSPLFYGYAGIQVDGERLVIAYPGRRLQRVVSLAKPPGTFRIAAVGDSLTEHWDAPGYANYTDFLEEFLQPRVPGGAGEVLPLGVGGYNTWQERHFFERHLARLEMDVWLLQYCANDADVMTLRAREPGERVASNEWPSHEILGARFGRPDFSRATIGPIPSRLLWLVRRQFSSFPGLDGYHQVAGNDEQRAALVWFRGAAAARKIPLLVVIFPLLDDGYAQPESRYIARLLAELGIDHCDVLPALQQHGPLKALARDVYHPSNAGHRIVARAILDALDRRGLLPAR